MFKLYTFTAFLLALSCSDGEQNTPSITDAVVSRPFAPAIAPTSVAPTTNDLAWINRIQSCPSRLVHL